MDASKNQTDPRIVRTRHLIKEAFVDLLKEMDIEKMTVSKIAARATISRVTFYLHYRDIPDMLEKMADDMIEDIQQILYARTEKQYSSNADWLVLTSLLEHFAEHSSFYKETLGSRKTPIFMERLSNELTKMITERIKEKGNAKIGNGDEEIQTDIAMWYGSSALIGTIVAWLRNDLPYTPHFLAKQFYLLAHKMEIDNLLN
ncbi:TetR-like C-terminal domain-containing protein [Niallia taxi]|uniref:TetR/AcrR family transcriptional regulator n=1 Tax=Niallia taxi TaxID=2499688 RepID=UPI002E1ECBFA|nr:TetR-like C-terminal domain-containing protein [Niallia taxi]MED4122029.1 TetR-like C-terminal domain-containing protein [Niallia taxi]